MKKPVLHLVIVDEEGTAVFYVLTPEAFARWEASPEASEESQLWEWLSVRSRPGQKRFEDVNKMISYVQKQGAEFAPEVLSTPAY